MEEEIDLRKYVEVLLRHWIWIVGLSVLAAVAAFVYTTVQPKLYQAEAIVLVTEPRYQIQFDSRFQTDQSSPAYSTFPLLATSDSILQHLVEAYEPSAAAEISSWRLSTVSGMVEATSEGDPSLIVLKVRSRSVKDAAALANTWADVLVTQGNAIFDGGAKDVLFFESQSAEAAEALDEVEGSLIEFQARNQSSLVEARLNSLRRTQEDYLASQRGITYIVQDIEALRAQLADEPSERSASLADNLTALLLQIKAFNAEASAPIQLQVDSSTTFSDKTTAEQIAFLDGLVAILQAKSLEIDVHLAELEPQILSLQQQLQQIDVESGQLNRMVSLARDTYVTLSRKLEEARITAQEENGLLRVGSYAAVPTRPLGSHRLLNTIGALVLGLMVGAVAAFAVEFWRENQNAKLSD